MLDHNWIIIVCLLRISYNVLNRNQMITLPRNPYSSLGCGSVLSHYTKIFYVTRLKTHCMCFKKLSNLHFYLYSMTSWPHHWGFLFSFITYQNDFNFKKFRCTPINLTYSLLGITVLFIFTTVGDLFLVSISTICQRTYSWYWTCHWFSWKSCQIDRRSPV